MYYKEYIKELGESAKKMELSGLPSIAAEYRKAADVIKDLLERNKVQAERIKCKDDEICKLKSRLHDTKSERR